MIALLTAAFTPSAGSAAADAPQPPKPEPGVQERRPGAGVDVADALQLQTLRSLQRSSTVPLRARFADGRPEALRGRIPVEGVGVAAQARDFLDRYATGLWRLTPNSELVLARTDEGVGMASYTQRYRGLPVIGGEVNVLVQDGDVHAVLGKFMPGDGLDVTPAIDANQARVTAAGRVGRLLAPPELAIRFEDGPTTGERTVPAHPRLVWVVSLALPDNPATIASDARMVTRDVDANTGALVAEEDTDTEFFPFYDAVFFDANQSAIPDGATCQWEAPGIEVAGTEHGLHDPYETSGYYELAWANTGRAYTFALTEFGRVSFDGMGAKVIGNLESTRTTNGMWSPTCQDIHWRDAYGSSDVPVHEFGHGINTFTSGLKNSFQPGALNEAFGDIMAALADQDGDEWVLGEDNIHSSNITRSLEDPPVDRMGEFDEDEDNSDKGGVHTNNGIINKMAYLLSEGGLHPDTGRQVAGIGREKAGKLLYAGFTNLTRDSRFTDFGNVTEALSLVWIELDRHGWTESDLCSVRNAFAAVEVNEASGDADCDGTGDGAETDADDDGIHDSVDPCPGVPSAGTGASACDADDDDDGVLDEDDNCPTHANEDQADLDGDGVGEACQDDDGDSVVSAHDNCPDVYNPGQEDSNGDGFYGDACDPDTDGDGVPASGPDNCPNEANPDQQDGDGDGYGDACDPCPATTDGSPAFTTWGEPYMPDSDGDGLADDCDPSFSLPGGREAVSLSREDQPVTLTFDTSRRVPIPVAFCPALPCPPTDLPRHFVLDLGPLPEGVTAMVTDAGGQAWARSADMPDGASRMSFQPRGDRRYFLTFTAGPGAPLGPVSATVERFLAQPPPVSAANVSVALDAAPDQVLAGDAIEYTMTVANTTLTDATGVAVELAIDGPVQVADATRGIGTLDAGETRTLTFTGEVGPHASGPLVAKATVSSATTDPVPADDTATATVTATDPYAFDGFRPPVENPPLVNAGRAGRVYPVKFTVTDEHGAVVSDVGAVDSISFKRASCAAFTGDPSDAIEATAGGGSALRFDDGQFIYGWRTPSKPGCYELFVILADGGMGTAGFELR